jgi:hypothetical protein
MATWIRLGGRTVTSSQTTTDTRPAHGSMDGVNLNDVAGFTVTIECDPGQTFSGAGGSLQAWFDDDAISDVSYLPEVDLVLPAGAVGQRRVSFGGFTVASPRGFLAHIANSIQVTGGGLTVTYTCSTLYGNRT